MGSTGTCVGLVLHRVSFTVAAARPPLRKLIRRVIRASVSTRDANVSAASKSWSALHLLLDTLPLFNLLQGK
jgi:hypothetical protein